MIYETGKTYILDKERITIRVEEIGDEHVIMRLLAGSDGKIPDEAEYLQGPTENFQGWMDYNNAKEVE